MRANRILLTLLLALLPMAGYAALDDEEMVEIKLHSTTPSGSKQHAPGYCPISCLYDVMGKTILISADQGDYYGTRINIQNLTMDTLEYSYTSTMTILDEMITVSGNAEYSIQIITTTGKTYTGTLTTL